MTYGAKTTASYKAREAAEKAGGAKIQLVSFAVGDGNGAVPLLSAIETGLIHQVYAAPILSASVNPGNALQVDIVCPLPATDGAGAAIGPFVIREVAIFDEQGHVAIVANTQIEKTTAASGQVSSFNLTISVAIDDATPLILTPATTYATSDDILSIDAALLRLLQGLAAAQTELSVHRASTDQSTGAPVAL